MNGAGPPRVKSPRRSDLPIPPKAEVTNILTRMIGREIELTNQGFQIGQSGLMVFKTKGSLSTEKRRLYRYLISNEPNSFLEITSICAPPELSVCRQGNRQKSANAMGYRTRINHQWDRAHEKIIGSRGGVPLTVKHLQRNH